MRFQFDKVDQLPRLAWCARIRRGDTAARVIHGPWVETADGWFVEGAWNGPFAETRFADATILLGSGGCASGDELTFSTPSHSLERLQLLRLGEDEILVSNSLAFLFAQADDAPDPGYFFYDYDLISFVDGLSRIVPQIPTRRGRQIELVYCSNLIVHRDLTTRQERRQEPRPFADYADYIEFLRHEIAAIHRNATDPARRHPKYEPLATVSSGYDSPACAVLAKTVGCTEAMTFGKARPEFGDGDDNGLGVGKILGLKVTEYDRKDYCRRDDFPQAEFLAVGTGGEDVVMCAFEAQLPGRMLFTGFLGDILWGRLHPNPQSSEDFAMKSPSGSSLTEFRLRVGFVHAPLPMMSYTRHPSLHRIANSDEMKPWRSGNPRYDRPVPRRVAEQAGVPRHLFGQAKRAVTQPFYHNEPLGQIMSPHSYADFRTFAGEGRDLNRDSGHALKLAILPRIYPAHNFINRALATVAGQLGVAVPTKTWVPRNYRQRLTQNALTFHWAQEKLRPRYAVGRPPQNSGR